MKKQVHLIMLLVSLLCGSLPLGAGAATTSPDSVRLSSQVSAPIYFRQGRSDIDPAFLGNRERMESFVNSLRQVLANPDYVVNKVRVVGMASPEGSRARNEELAGARAQALAAFITDATGVEIEKIEVVNGGENWAGLYAMIEASDEVPDKAQLLAFWQQYGDDRDALKHRIQYYNGSRAWKYMYENFFPILRTGAGGTVSSQLLSQLSRGNWNRMNAILDDLDVDESTRQNLAAIMNASPDRLSESQSLLDMLQAINEDAETYADMKHKAVDYLLAESSEVSDRNWEFLRARIAASNIDNKEELLQIIDNVPVARREQQLRELNGGESYAQIEKLYPELLAETEAAEAGRAASAAVTAANWNVLRAVAERSNVADKAQVLAIIDNEPDPVVREQKLRELNGGESYRLLADQAAPELLFGSELPAGRQQLNRALVRKRVAASSIAAKQEILAILDSESDPQECVRKLNALSASDDAAIVSAILTADGNDLTPALSATTSAANWELLREMIAVSDMPDKSEAIAIIDNEPDPAVRQQKLQQLNGGYTYRYMKEVFFPELLYGLSSSAKENWKLLEQTVADSDMANREEILNIIKSTPAGVEREEALRALDGGKTWNEIREAAFSALLLNTDPVEVTGTGMSFSFEESPAAKERAEALRRQQAEERLAEARRREQEKRMIEERERAAAEQARLEAEAAAAVVYRSSADFALKTDLVLWGSLMPCFDFGSYTPNLSGELFFARRWSIQLGGAYSNWNAFAGNHGLYALTAVDVEPRVWFKKNGYRGFYAGVYGTYGDFDIQTKEGLTGTTGTYFFAGASIGWQPRLSAHWFFDLNVRLGYRSAKCSDYTVGQGYYEGHYYLDSHRTSGKFAPQLRLQLAYRFGKSGK